MAEENRGLMPQDLKPFLVYAQHLGFKNLNPQQEKALAEFLSGSNVFVNLPMGYGKSIYQMAPLMVIELSKQHRNFPSYKSIVVCKIYLKKSLKPCSSPLIKIIILLLICTAG